MQHRGVVSPHGLIFFCIVSLFVLGLFVVPAIAQDTGAGPPAGTPVTASNPESPSSPPNLFVIPARGCRVSDGASVTLEEEDGTRARVVDGRSVDITATATQISIKITGDQFLSDVATFLDPNDQSFDTGNEITVVTTTGISCQGTGAIQQRADDNAAQNHYNAADAQYADNVIKDTIPDKKILVDTGGLSLAMIGEVILAIGLVGLGIFLLRRT
jgi:hypothetical protein